MYCTVVNRSIYQSNKFISCTISSWSLMPDQTAQVATACCPRSPSHAPWLYKGRAHAGLLHSHSALSHTFPLLFSSVSSAMVVLAKGELEQIALPAAEPPVADVRTVDLSAAAGPARDAAARALVAACEEHGFFRVTGHGVPAGLVRAAEAAAAGFFALPQGVKDGEAPTLGYGSKKIGGNGDLGWIEYLLLGVTPAGAVPAATSASSSTLPCAAAAAASSSSSTPPPGPLR